MKMGRVYDDDGEPRKAVASNAQKSEEEATNVDELEKRKRTYNGFDY